MFIVTNREVNDSKTGLDKLTGKPNPKGPNELRLVEAKRAGKGWHIDILPDEATPAMIAEVGLTPEIDPDTGKPKPIFASRYVARKVLARVNPRGLGLPGQGRNLLFFVHGYNNDLGAVLDRAAVFEQLYDVEVVAFSWPANGGGVHGTISYLSDKRDAQASVGALDRCFGKLAQYLQEIHADHVKRIEAEANARFTDDAEKWNRFFSEQSQKWCPFTVNMVLHSMGNYLFKHVLGSSAYRGDCLIFDNVVLAAADANNKGHAEWVDRIRCRRRVYVTINERDIALAASRAKAGEEQLARLGHWIHDLHSTQAVYVDFTDAPHVGDSHAYFEGKPAEKNERVRGFFDTAFNGEFAEKPLRYDPSKNVHFFR